MSDENRELVEGAYEAFGRGDIDAILSVMSDDVEWHVPTVLPQGMDVRGRDGVVRFLARISELWDDFQVEVEDFLISDDRLAVMVRTRGKLEGADASYRAVHAWTVRDGKVVGFHEYVDVGSEGVESGA
jgi:ketosteroid isomerase-like protein